jgi:hypothetical protein
MLGAVSGTELRAGAQRLAARGGTLDVVLAGVAALLGEVLAHDGAVVATLDPATGLPTRVWPADGLGPLDDPLAHSDLIDAPTPLTTDPGPPSTLRAVLRARGAAWGTVDLVRGGPGRAFTPDEVAAVADAGPSLADLLRLTMLRTALATPGSVPREPGLVLVDEHGQAELARQGDGWLEIVAERDAIPSAIRAVTAAARSGDGLARAALPSRDGEWVVLHGSPLHGYAGGDNTVAIIVEGSQPLVLAPGLVDTEERNPELLAAIHHEHYWPRLAAGAEPSPYGWYLA